MQRRGMCGRRHTNSIGAVGDHSSAATNALHSCMEWFISLLPRTNGHGGRMMQCSMQLGFICG